MAAVSGPRTVTDGLVLNLDAANSAKAAGLTSVQYLIVAGGGSGAGGIGAGGGAGGLLQGTTTITPQTYTITVGAGGLPLIGGSSVTGAAGNNGGNSTALGLTAIGGGHGGRHREGNNNGTAGGSGGGAGNNGVRTGGAGTAEQGNRGGDVIIAGAPNWASGGGGGAGQPGQDIQDGRTDPGGTGGAGIASSIEGNMYWYAGGGGGGVYNGPAGAGSGGLGGGGGGAASAGSAGLGGIGRSNGSNGASGGGTSGGAAGANTGGGGGGGAWDQTFGGAGGSGIVVIRYPGPQRATGGTVTRVGGDTVHTFTTVGSSTFVPLPSFANGVAFTGVPDLSGLNNVGTAVNGPVYSTANGGSFVFDGVNDYVDCGNPTSLSSIGGTTNITVSAWVYYTAFGGGGQPYSVITVKGNPWTWLMENPSNTFRFRITAGVTDASLNDTAAHLLNVWYNVVGTYNGTDMRLYVNGVLKNTRAQAGALATNSVTAKIGTYQGTNYNFTGRISNVRIYNRALTQAEIAQNFEAQRGRFGI